MRKVLQTTALSLLGLAAISPLVAVSVEPSDTESTDIHSAVSYVRKSDYSRISRDDVYSDCFGVDILQSWNVGATDAAIRNQIESYIEQIAVYDGGTRSVKIEYEYNDLFYVNDEQAGYVVDFVSGDDRGYAIFFVSDGNAQLIEISLDGESPYRGKVGKYVYPAFGTYCIKSTNGEILEINESAMTSIASTYSNSSGYIEDSLKYNYYSGNKTIYRNLALEMYTYQVYSTDLLSSDNTCACIAGVIALNYWNMYFSNRLLKLDKSEMDEYGRMTLSTAKIYANKFYDYMNTNWIVGCAGGTLPDMMYAGYEKVINETNNGYYTNRVTVNGFEEMKSQLSRGVPVFITSTDYYFIDWILPDLSKAVGNNVLTLNYKEYSGLFAAHTFVGYGYAEYELYDNNNNRTSVQLIEIIDGWGAKKYYHVNESNLISAAAIKVLSLGGC